ncbi:MAG TPA: nuclear transport factor 2 family protein [Acidobacteriaceae bacterium]
MRLSSIGVFSTAMLLCVPFSAFAVKPEAKTAAAVVAADDGWDQAEETGDTAYIDNLLLPEYRSVNADGSVHDKAAIVASAKKNVSSPEHAAKVAKWKATHPMGTGVVLQGDTAIVTFYLKPLGPEKGIMSSDIFVYRGGQWHAIYSQHTTAGM